MSMHRPASPEAVLAQEDFIRALARQLLRDPGAADDVTQDTLVTALHQGPVEGGRLRGWMAAVARNGARRVQRGESRRRDREFESARPENGVPSPEEIADREAARRRVVQAVLALEADHRDALVLRYWEGLDAKAMATRLKLSVEGARTRLKRAHARLRAELMQREGRDWRQAIAPVAFGGLGAGAGGTLLAVGWKVAAAALLAVGIGAATIPGARSNAAPVGGGVGPGVALVEGDEEEEPGDLAGATTPGSTERREVTTTVARSTAHRMRVRVVDQDGEPLAGSEVWFEGLAQEPSSADAAEWESFEIEDHREVPSEPSFADVSAEEAPRRGGVALAGMGYSMDVDETPAGDLTVSAVTGEDGWVVLRFDEEAAGTVNVWRAKGRGLSTRHLEPRPIETGSGSHVIVVPRMASATVTLEVRSLDGGQRLDEYQVDVFQGRTAVVETLQAEEGIASFQVDVHPAIDGEVAPTNFQLEVRAPDVAPIVRTLRLNPGEEREMVLRHGWLQRVTGVVQTADGSPVAGARVVPGDTNAFRNGVAYLPYEGGGDLVTDDQGRFELMTAAGQVAAHHADHGAASASSEGEVVLVLPGLASIRGQALALDGEPIVDGYVHLDYRGAGRTDEQGRYHIEGVEPGVHQVGVEGMRAKVEVAAGEELVFDFGAQWQPTTVVLPGLEGFVSIFGEDATCSILSRSSQEETLVLERALPGSYWLIHTEDLMVRVDLMPGAQTVPVPSGSLVVTATPDERLWLVPAGASAHLESLIRFSNGRTVPGTGNLTWSGVAPGGYDLLRLDGRRDRVHVGADEVTHTLKD